MQASGISRQITKMHSEGLAASQIAQALRMDITDVDLHLVSASGSKSQVAVSAKERLKNRIANLEDKAIERLDATLDNDDFPHLQLASARFIVEVGLGKHDGTVSSQQPQNLTQVNQIIIEGLKAYEQIERSYDENKDKVVDRPVSETTIKASPSSATLREMSQQLKTIDLQPA